MDALTEQQYRRYLAKAAELDGDQIEDYLRWLGEYRSRVPRTVATREEALRLFEAQLKREFPPQSVAVALDSVRHYWHAVDQDRGQRVAGGRTAPSDQCHRSRE
ncbi:MAG: hypothetical protein KAU31_11560 [Spirochaetaceae bacterium]|nr:hypothetical protein [Spirochaetaceae bacterium]